MVLQTQLFKRESWSVTDITRYLKELIESDHNLTDIWVQGEVSNFSRPRSGHLYFTVKDSGAALRVVMWRSAADRLIHLPQDGDSVEVHGKISIYETGGQYQLYANLIRPLGEGALYQEFLRLKAQLESEGLFEDERKRPIPPRPERIGIITSPTGAALRDMLNTLRRRYPLVEVTLAPTAVQGEDAPAGIVMGLQTLNRVSKPDVILVARGGGSIEDLWAFNDEQVARAIAASEAPVISGVGHQTDFTIADFVADLRAPTPTAAAELATPERADLHMAISELSQQLDRSILDRVNTHRWSLSNLANQLYRCSPEARIQSDRQRLDEMVNQVQMRLMHHLQIQRTRILSLEQHLTALNPMAVIARGYAVVTQPDGEIVRRVNQAVPGDHINIRLSDGSLPAEVLKDG